MDGTPFAVLGVPEHASQIDIKRAFRTKARQTHPDRGGCRAEFEAVLAAFEQLRRRRPNPFVTAIPAPASSWSLYDSPRRPVRRRARFEDHLRSAMGSF